MFWKFAKKNLLNGISIKARLTLFYSIAGFILLTIIALFLYWETINILHRADYRFLDDEVDTVQYILHSKSYDPAALRQECVVEASKSNNKGSLYRYYIRVFDTDKKILIQTPGMENILAAQKSYDKKAELLGKKTYSWYTFNDTNYLLIQAPIQIGTNNRMGLIQIALDLSYQHGVVNDRKKLVIALLAGTILAFLIGSFIANRGIRSLYELTETTRNITAASLDQRIDPKSAPHELQALGKEFNQMLDRIETSFTRLKPFSADLAHELRIPINNLIGGTEIALSHPLSQEEYQQVLESNLEEFHRVSHLIENILFLARAENPQLDMKKVPLKAHTEIELISEFYQMMAEEKNISITHQGQAELQANSVMFRRMLGNILSNALKYTPAGGAIHFDIAEMDSKFARIILSDNGIGIAPEHLPKIFNRFYRVDAARSQQSGGTGLGLAIVKSIVELHHGNISIESEIGKGTNITIILPTV